MDLVTMPDEETNVTFGDLDFDAIEAAVMETARGRWFLKEYARRNRVADTQAVLDALDRLKDDASLAHFKTELQDMATAIQQTKDAIRSFPTTNSDGAANELSEAELQAAAEQRIRQMIRTFHDLERHINNLLAQCKEGDRNDGSLGAGPFEGEKARHLHPHPAFLM